VAGKDLGRLLYRDPVNSQGRLLRGVVLATALLGIVVVFAPVVSRWTVRDILAIGYAMLGFFALTFVMGTAVQAIGPGSRLEVREKGLVLPSPLELSMLERPDRIPYSDLEWVHHDDGRPWRGVRFGFRDGEEFGIAPREMGDPLALLQALGGRVPRVREDPRLRKTLDRFDTHPSTYLKLWASSPRTFRSKRSAVTAVIAVLLGLTIPLPLAGLPRPYLTICVLVAVTLVGVAYAHVVTGGHLSRRLQGIKRRGPRLPSLEFLDAEPSTLFRAFDDFLHGGTLAGVRDAGRSGRSRMYSLPQPSAGLHLYLVEDWFGMDYWRLDLLGNDPAGGSFDPLRTALARFAIETGLFRYPDIADIVLKVAEAPG